MYYQYKGFDDDHMLAASWQIVLCKNTLNVQKNMRGIYYFPIILPFNFPVVLIAKDYYQICNLISWKR